MSIFIIFLSFATFYVIYRKSIGILCNELFWLCLFWLLIVGVFLYSGVYYGVYGRSAQLIVFLSLCSVAFYIGRKRGLSRKVYVYDSESISDHTKYTILGVFCLFIYLFEIFRLNGISIFFMSDYYGKRETYISNLGAISSLFVPILLVQGLYLFSKQYVEKSKFSLYGALLLLLYCLPSVLQTGRESFLYIIIGIISIYGFKSEIKNSKFSNNLSCYHFVQVKKQKIRDKIIIKILIPFIILLIGYFIYYISIGRFTDNEINAFLVNNSVSPSTQKEALLWGHFEFIYYNILSYFSHQLPFLDLQLQHYNGPYMCGLYELNIISRRLPDSLGLDYKSVYESYQTMFIKNHCDFTGGWNTILGSFISDFGRVGAVFMSFIVGYVVGKIRKK